MVKPRSATGDGFLLCLRTFYCPIHTSKFFFVINVSKFFDSMTLMETLTDRQFCKKFINPTLKLIMINKKFVSTGFKIVTTRTTIYYFKNCKL